PRTHTTTLFPYTTLFRSNKSVCTIANPEKIAPATKYGGKMAVCQPGITDVAKSIDTMVWTESTNGVEIPARIKETISKRCHVLTDRKSTRLNSSHVKTSY